MSYEGKSVIIGLHLCLEDALRICKLVNVTNFIDLVHFVAFNPCSLGIRTLFSHDRTLRFFLL